MKFDMIFEFNILSMLFIIDQQEALVASLTCTRPSNS